MVKLPQAFLDWNYYFRRRWAQEVIKGRPSKSHMSSMEIIFRVLPAISTAAGNPDGSISVNSKIVGVGYVLKEEYLAEATRDFVENIIDAGEKLLKAGKTGFDFLRQETISETLQKLRGIIGAKDAPSTTRPPVASEYELTGERFSSQSQKRGMELLLRHCYLDPDEAEKRMDFTKLCTIELGHRYDGRPTHMWNYVKENPKACILYYHPPSISYEIRCNVEVHMSGKYADYVRAVHDVWGGISDVWNKPIYILNVEEVYDNSATPKGYGRKLA